MAEEARAPPKREGGKKLIIVISIAVAIIAIIAIASAFLMLPKKMSVAKPQVQASVKLKPTALTYPVYTLNFKELKGVASAIPLTYPDPNGIVFLSVRTRNGTNEVWTFKGEELVGRYKLNGTVVPVFDVRKGEYATLDGKLLLGVSGTLYEIYGSKATPLAKYSLAPRSKIAIFVKKGNVYLWVVKLSKTKANVSCALYELNKVEKKFTEIKNITFGLGPNVTSAAPLPDLLDGKGCMVMWVKRGSPTMYYIYKGLDGEEVKGSLNLMKMRVATFAPLFLEVAPYNSKPFFMLITLSGRTHNFVLRLHDVLDNKTVTFNLTGLYNFVSIGDFLGNGYVGDALFTVLGNGRTITLKIVDVHGKYQDVNVGKVKETLALFTGITFGPHSKRVFGLGNFTISGTTDVVTNIGKLRFKVQGIPQNVSSLYVVGSLDGTKLCYTAIVNPAVGGFTTPQRLVKGNVYLATGCQG